MIDEGNPKGMQNYWSGRLPGRACPTRPSTCWSSTPPSPVSPLTQMLLVPGGGALARVDNDATAFGQRDAPWNVHFLSMWPDPADSERNIAYTRAIATAMKPWTTGRVYLNFIGDEGSGRVEAAYGPERYARLQALKAKWDPENVFRHNQNIAPAT